MFTFGFIALVFAPFIGLTLWELLPMREAQRALAETPPHSQRSARKTKTAPTWIQIAVAVWTIAGLALLLSQ